MQLSPFEKTPFPATTLVFILINYTLILWFRVALIVILVSPGESEMIYI